MSDIPGLLSIEAPDCGNVITFHLDPDRAGEFFSTLGLDMGDEKGLTDLVTRAIEMYLDTHGSGIEESQTR